MSTWYFESQSQKHYQQGQLTNITSNFHRIEVQFISTYEVQVNVEGVISGLIAEFADESNGMRAFVSDNRQWVFQLVTKTGQYESPDDIQECIVMATTTTNFIIFSCEPVSIE